MQEAVVVSSPPCCPSSQPEHSHGQTVTSRESERSTKVRTGGGGGKDL